MGGESSDKTSNILKFLHICHNLKTTKRTGWINHNVQKAESISDHMYMLALICWTVNDPNVQKDKCVKMAIVHDLAESIVGDITPYDGISEEDKAKMEENALKGLVKLLDEDIGNEIYDLWKEYEEASTPESKLVKQIDKFEMALQAFRYEKDQSINLENFYNSVEGKLENPRLVQWFSTLKEERKAFEFNEEQKPSQ